MVVILSCKNTQQIQYLKAILMKNKLKVVKSTVTKLTEKELADTNGGAAAGTSCAQACLTQIGCVTLLCDFVELI